MAAIQIWSKRYRTRVSKLLALIRIPLEQTSGINGITKRVGSGQLFAGELGNQCPPVRHSRTQPANLRRASTDGETVTSFQDANSYQRYRALLLRSTSGT